MRDDDSSAPSRLSLVETSTRAARTFREEEVGRFLLRISPYAVAIADAQQRVRYWSPSAETLFGYDAGEVLGRVLAEILSPEGTALSAFWEDPGAGPARGGFPADRNVRRKDGQWLRVEFTRRPLRAPADSSFDLFVFRDVSERVMAQRLESEAERVLALRLLAGELSHEVRNPLHSIALNLEMLREDLSGLAPADRAAEVEDMFRRIDHEIRSLRVVADEYLELARHPLEQRSEVLLPEFLGALLRFLATELRVGRVEVATEFAPDLPPVSLFTTRFKQAFLNLVRNAVEAMPTGGLLDVRAFRDGDGVRIEVSDTGVGMTPENAARLFTPFHSTKEQGTGLGLVVSREAVEAHGGRLESRSRPGWGTTFAIWLPRG